MALDFQGLQTEVFARGFQYLNDAGTGLTRVKRWINDANHRINDLEPWQYLQALTTGTSPISVTDLGRVLSVFDPADKRTLSYLDERDLRDAFTVLSTTGTPEWYYIADGNVVATYPESTATLTIRYVKVQTDMSANGDVPLMPDRFRMAIVEYAVAQAYRDNDNPAAAASASAAGDDIVRRMLEWNTLLPGMGGEQRITQGGDW